MWMNGAGTFWLLWLLWADERDGVVHLKEINFGFGQS